MFWLNYKHPSSDEIRVPNKSYHTNYSKPLFISVHTVETSTSHGSTVRYVKPNSINSYEQTHTLMMAFVLKLKHVALKFYNHMT